MKRIHGYLMLLPLVLAASSCGESLDWGNIDAYKEATELQSGFVVSGGNLTINVDNANNYLKNPTKDKIIVQSRAAMSQSNEVEGNEINADILKKVAITDFSLEVGDNVAITLNSFEATTYTVIFHKDLTSDGKFAFASVSLDTEEGLEQPYVIAAEDDYVLGDSDPAFGLTYGNLTPADTSKIDFAGALEGLVIKDCKQGEGILTFSTSGFIAGKGAGHVILQKGFFEENSEDIDLIYKIETPAYSIDNSSFALKNGEFSFLMLLSSAKRDSFTSGTVSIGNYTSSRVQLHDGDGVGLEVYIPFSGTLEEAIKAMANQPISFSSGDLGPLADTMVFQVAEPIYTLDCTLSTKELAMEFYYRNAVAQTIPLDALAIASPQISLSGDSVTAEVKSFVQTADGFQLCLTLDEAYDSVTGTLSFLGGDFFKTLWGTRDENPILAIDCEITSVGAQGEFDESYCEKVLTASPGVDVYANVLTFSLLAAQYGISHAMGNPIGVIGSLLGIMELFGLRGHSEDPTIQDVLNKLEDIANQIKVIDRKIDALHREIQDNRIATEIGMTKILFNQYHGAWEAFNSSTIRPTEDLLRDYTADIRSYQVKFVWDNENAKLDLKYFDKDGKSVIGMENPHSAGYTLDGYKITSTKTVTITKSYFQEAADLARRAQGYCKDFDKVFRKCLSANMKAEYPDLSDTDLEKLCSDVYAQIQGQAQFASVDEERAKAMVNCFINFANGILSSQVDNLFHMLESLYNFQSEARKEILQFRCRMKILLDKYAGFATTMAQFCPGIQKPDITSAYQSAVKILRDRTYLQTLGEGEVYCYPTHSKLSAKVVKASFNTYFKDAPSNSCSFGYNFGFEDLNTGKKIETLNLGALVTETDLNIIYARVLNALRVAGKSVTAIDFYKYLKENKVITDALISNDKVKYAGKDVIVSYGGINSLSANDFLTRCVAQGMGDYFSVGGNYVYATVHGAQWWSGREASGDVYNLDSRSTVSKAIERYARFDQSHWYWVNDEHWSYESLYGEEVGRTAFMFLKS